MADRTATGRDETLRRTRALLDRLGRANAERRRDDRREIAKRVLTIGIAAAALVFLIVYVATGGPGPRQPYQGDGECVESSRWEFC
jgi:hypothetical protein